MNNKEDNRFLNTRLGQEIKKTAENLFTSAVNNIQPVGVVVSVSDNGGFVITPTLKEGERQKLFTATTIDETMIIVREQLEGLTM